MKKLNYSVKINAPKEKVWDILWNDVTYGQWTAPFSPESKAISDWKEGGEVIFLGDKGLGMFSKIDKKVENELMSFEHIGMVKDGKKQPMDEETKSWSGAQENYRLKESDGSIELLVDLEVSEKEEESFNTIFPKSLEIVKKLAEA